MYWLYHSTYFGIICSCAGCTTSSYSPSSRTTPSCNSSSSCTTTSSSKKFVMPLYYRHPFLLQNAATREPIQSGEVAYFVKGRRAHINTLDVGLHRHLFIHMNHDFCLYFKYGTFILTILFEEKGERAGSPIQK